MARLLQSCNLPLESIIQKITCLNKDHLLKKIHYSTVYNIEKLEKKCLTIGKYLTKIKYMPTLEYSTAINENTISL